MKRACVSFCLALLGAICLTGCHGGGTKTLVIKVPSFASVTLQNLSGPVPSVFGGSTSPISFTATGTVTCAVVGPGTCVVNGTTVVYNSPSTCPLQNTATVTLTATLTNGTIATTHFDVQLQPRIDSLAVEVTSDGGATWQAFLQNTLYTPDEKVAAIFRLHLTGVGLCATTQFSVTPTANLGFSQNPTPYSDSVLTMTNSAGNYNPGKFAIQATPQGGATSNTMVFWLLPSVNQSSLLGAKIYSNEQSGGKALKEFAPLANSTGPLIATNTFSTNGGYVVSPWTDPTTGQFGVMYHDSLVALGGGTSHVAISGISDGSCGFARCVAIQRSSGTINIVDLAVQPTPAPVQLSLTGAWTGGMMQATIPGQPPTLTVVLSVGGPTPLLNVYTGGTFNALYASVPLTGMTPLRALGASGTGPTTPPNGGWFLVTAGNFVGVFSAVDKKVFVVDVAAPLVGGTLPIKAQVDVNAIGQLPYLLAAGTNGTFVVLTLDASAGVTKLLTINPSATTPTATAIPGTFPGLATGYGAVQNAVQLLFNRGTAAPPQ